MKFAEYKTLPSFKEYVIVKQDAYHIECWFREEENLWRMETYKDINDTVFLKSMDCSISMKEVYRNVVFGKGKG